MLPLRKMLAEHLIWKGFCSNLRLQRRQLCRIMEGKEDEEAHYKSGS